MKTFKQVASLSGLRRISNLDCYFRDQVFNGVDTENKKLIDIGGGNGLASIWSLMEGGCKEALVVDPLSDGSNSFMFEQFQSMKTASGVDGRLQFFIGKLSDLNSERNNFDIALMHNSVNHINEKMTPLLMVSERAREAFLNEFKSIRSRMTDNGILIISDCSNRNFFGDMGIKNPIAPTINWTVHQSPNVWSPLIEASGFKHLKTTWTTRRELGRVGHAILGNKVGAYLTNSHFAMVFGAVACD